MLTGIVGKYFLEVGAEKEIKKKNIKDCFLCLKQNW
jgi:hypothetical protein